MGEILANEEVAKNFFAYLSFYVYVVTCYIEIYELKFNVHYKLIEY